MCLKAKGDFNNSSLDLEGKLNYFSLDNILLLLSETKQKLEKEGKKKVHFISIFNRSKTLRFGKEPNLNTICMNDLNNWLVRFLKNFRYSFLFLMT